MVNRFDLKQALPREFTDDAIQELHKHSRFKLTDASSIQISVEDRNRFQRSADMANAYGGDFLDQFQREVRMSKGRRTRTFIETRLAEMKGSSRGLSRD